MKIIRLLCKIGIHIKRYNLVLDFKRVRDGKSVFITYKPCKYCSDGDPRLDGEF